MPATNLKPLVYLGLLPTLVFFFRCKNTIYDGPYCAQVNYYNKNTGTASEYTLYAEVENNILKEIKFPSGYLNKDHFGEVKVDSKGKANIIIEENQEYSIKLTGDVENCMTNVPKAIQCRGTTRSGRRCRNKTDNPSGLCWHHNK